MILNRPASNQITLCKKCSFEPVYLLGHSWESYSQMGKRQGLQIQLEVLCVRRSCFTTA